MPRAIELMRRREEELSKAVLYLSEKTNGFTEPRIVLIGGYALRVFIPFSRFTRDCARSPRSNQLLNSTARKMVLFPLDRCS